MIKKEDNVVRGHRLLDQMSQPQVGQPGSASPTVCAVVHADKSDLSPLCFLDESRVQPRRRIVDQQDMRRSLDRGALVTHDDQLHIPDVIGDEGVEASRPSPRRQHDADTELFDAHPPTAETVGTVS